MEGRGDWQADVCVKKARRIEPRLLCPICRPFVQAFIHYFLHLVFPGILAWIFYRARWMKAWVILLCTMAVDLDHLLATPIFDPCRCSIGYHPLHSWWAIVAYALMLLHPKLRLVAIGLLLHMATDGIDCGFSGVRCG